MAVAGAVVVVLVDRVLGSVGTADPGLVVGAAALAVAPVDGLELAVHGHRLIQARVTDVLAVLQHLFAFDLVTLDEHVVQTVDFHGLSADGHLKRGLLGCHGLVPVERTAVRPREHLHVLLRRAVAHTRVRDEVRPGIAVAARGRHHAVAMDHLRAGLHEVGRTECVRVVLLRVAGRHHQVVRIAGGRVLVDELFAGVAERHPAVGVIVAVPHRTGVLHVVLAVIVRLRVVEQRGGGELQDLALQRQGSGQRPAPRIRARLVRAGIAPHEVVALDDGVQQADHELHGLVHTAARQVIAVLRTGERPLDDRETAVEAERDEIETGEQAARLILHPLLLVCGKARHVFNMLQEVVALAHVLPDRFVQVGVDRTVVVGLIR